MYNITMQKHIEQILKLKISDTEKLILIDSFIKTLDTGVTTTTRYPPVVISYRSGPPTISPTI